MPKKILLIDNNDSFTYNLVELLRQLNICFKVVTIQAFEPSQIADFSHIIISPGPDVPRAYPKLFKMLALYQKNKSFHQKPMLGVCLGHQIIGEFFGATVYNLTAPRHGMVGQISLNTHPMPIFADLPAQFEVGLYHSWAISAQDFPQVLQVTATCQDGVIMTVQHITLPIFGVQFHPESYISEFGKKMLANFFEI